MNSLPGLLRRIRDTLWRRRADQRMEEEMRFHLDMEAQKHVARGLDAAAARRRALLDFGGIEAHREALRDDRAVPLLEPLWQDVRYAVRSLRRAPGLAFAVIPTLAIAIGAATAMFSVLHGVLLRELPVHAQEEVLVAWTASPSRGTDHLPLSWHELQDLSQRIDARVPAQAALGAVAGAAYQGALDQVVLVAGSPVRARATWVTGGFFDVVRPAPVLGRTLAEPDDLPGADPVLVVSSGFAERHFGTASAALGERIEWEGRLHTVVGVLPAGFDYPRHAEIWLPVLPAFPATQEQAAPGAQAIVFNAVIRMAPGASTAEVERAISSYLRATDSERAPALRDLQPVVTPLAALITGEVRRTLWLAAIAVALLLLVACVNSANVLLIRGSARMRELAVRSTLGAGPARLMRQLMTESGVLALLAGALGVLLAWGATATLASLAPAELPRAELVGIDGATLLAAFAVTAIAALLAGTLPAILIAGRDPGTRLRAGRGTGAAEGAGQPLRHGLVIAQVALAVIVVAGAALLVRSLYELQRAEPGFQREQLWIADISLPAHVRGDRAERVLIQEALVQRLAALPEVVSAAALPRPPFAGDAGWSAMFTADGQDGDTQGTNPWVNLEVVGAGYFETLQVPMRAGRGFTAADDENALPVAIISENVARHAWPGEAAVGRRIKLGPPAGPGQWHTVVGVAAETRYRELEEAYPTLYLPARQFGGPVPMNIALRTHGEAATLLPALRAALRDVHGDLLLVEAASMRQLMAAPLAGPRFSASLLTTFATVTLLLAVVGIFSTLTATVQLRTREIGVRMAVGARAEQVRALFLRQGLVLAGAGTLIGLGVVLAGRRALEGVLFGIPSHHAPTLAMAAAAIIAAAAAASYIPARRASRTDVAATMRAD
jgi:putative ABC transport system permease protein